jgi:hypothetical protein
MGYGTNFFGVPLALKNPEENILFWSNHKIGIHSWTCTTLQTALGYGWLISVELHTCPAYLAAMVG